LLIASRSMAVKGAPEFRRVRLAEIVQPSLSSFAIVASEKSIEIGFENATPGEVRGDEEGLRVLINNLIDNAIRYTPEGGHVSVRLSCEAGETILEVSDDGPGIPEHEHDRVFQRFYRIPGAASTGSGLGLSIVRSVAENHNDVATIATGLEQRGTTIRVTFPDSA
jgi:two-component system OmpR family sensor kinase